MNPIASQGSKLMVSNGTNNVDILPTFYIQLYQLPGTKFTARDLRFPVGQNRSWKWQLLGRCKRQNSQKTTKDKKISTRTPSSPKWASSG